MVLKDRLELEIEKGEKFVVFFEFWLNGRVLSSALLRGACSGFVEGSGRMVWLAFRGWGWILLSEETRRRRKTSNFGSSGHFYLRL
jgi:hypothetical protein